MKIVFEKIVSTPMPVEVATEGITLVATLRKIGYHRVMLDGKMSGELALSCDRCGDTYNSHLEGALALKLSDIISEDKDDLDIIEFLDGEIDMDYILLSELNTFRSTYNYCEKCSNSDEAIEVEY